MSELIAPPLRLGFVGVGGMGQCAHLRNYVTLPDCQVVALAELRPQLGQRVGQRYAIPQVYTDHRQMLAKEKLDALVHINRFDLHGQSLPELLATGLPVITEKPIASSPQMGARIAALAGQHGDRHYVAYHKRSDPATIWAKKQMASWQESGAAGKLRYVRVTMPPGNWSVEGFSHLLRSDETCPEQTPDPRPDDLDEPSFRRYVGLVNYYIHQVNMLRHLLGEDYQVSHADGNGLLMVCTSASGLTCIIEMAPYQSGTHDWQESALICYERGWIRLELPAPMVIDQPGRVIAYCDPGKGEPQTIEPSLPHMHAMRQQAKFFLQAVRGQQTPLCRAAEALKDLQVVRQYLDLFVQARGPVRK